MDSDANDVLAIIDDEFRVVEEINEGTDVDLAVEEEPKATEVKSEEVFYVDDNDDLNSEDGLGNDTLEILDDTVNEPDQDLVTNEGNGVEGTVSEDKAEEIEPDNVKHEEEEPEKDVSDHDDDDVNEIIEAVQEEQRESLTHPYRYLIETFEYEKDQMNVTKVDTIKTPQQTPFHMISSKLGVINMLQNLRNAKEIALDVQPARNEGPVSLIEISTRDANYMIDAFKVKSDLLMLTEVFINPQIVKILFNSRPVLGMLQEQLHLYMVNIFDVVKARAALKLKYNSLNNIIRTVYNYKRTLPASSDVCERPIPEDAKKFFRAGSHYLIYLYYQFKNQLLEDEDLYKKYLTDCRKACKVVFSIDKVLYKPIEDELKNRHDCELDVLKKIFDWRVEIAKRHSVSCDTVLARKSMFRMVNELPSEDDEILRIFNSRFLKANIDKLKRIITESKIRFKVRELKKKKKIYATADTGSQGNKRKNNETRDTQNKQRRIEHDSGKKKQNKYANRLRSYRIRQNPNPQRTLDPFNSRIARSDIDVFNNIASSSNNLNPVFLNPTNVPSSFTFQSSSIGSNIARNEFDRHSHEDKILQLSMGMYQQNERQNEPFGDGLYKSLADLKQVRDNLRRQGANFSSGSYQDLQDIDQKISILERNVQHTQPRRREDNRRNDNGSTFRRRY